MDQNEVNKENLVLVADGILSQERVNFLVEYGQEEERIDYKETLDCDKKNRGKIDIVCDLVAMANTQGGYVVIGVREESNAQFTPIGVTKEVLGLYKEENLRNWCSNYVDGAVTLRAVSRTIGGKDFLVFFMGKSNVPLIFKKDGTYSDNKGLVQVKFRAGDIYIRHGSVSERLTHADMNRLMLGVREDERQRVYDQRDMREEIVERLDQMVVLLGGNTYPTQVLGISVSSTTRLEDRAVREVSMGKPKQLIWLLKKEFTELKGQLGRMCEIENVDELAEVLDRQFTRFLAGLVPLWRVSVELDELAVGTAIGVEVYDLYDFCAEIPLEKGEYDTLWLQSRVVFLAYCLGAFAVSKSSPRFARLFLSKEATSQGELQGYSWFRTISIRLSRAGRSQNKTICRDVFEWFQSDAYLISIFGGEENLITAICQYDFLQCVYVLTVGNGNCYPSFAAYDKRRIDSMAEKIVRNLDSDSWIPQVDDDRLAATLRELDELAERQFFANWYGGLWDSPDVRRFIAQHSAG